MKLTKLRQQLAEGAARIAALAQELTELKSIINDDGSLQTHSEHVDLLRDAMHHLDLAGPLAERIQALEQELLRREGLRDGALLTAQGRMALAESHLATAHAQILTLTRERDDAQARGER